MSDELKPCPFCGGNPATRRIVEEYGADAEGPAGEYDAHFQIDCDTCGISIGGEHRSEATEAWNRRAPQPAVERAYGILWRDHSRQSPEKSVAARKELLTVLTKDGQKRGIEYALSVYGPTTASEIIAVDLSDENRSA